MRKILISAKVTAAAFSMYSALPLPRLSLSRRDVCFTMAAFPLVGFACAAAVWLWVRLCPAVGLGKPLCAAGMTAAPVLVSGGIHFSGFCSVSGILAERAALIRRPDLHDRFSRGAFEAFSAACYLMLYSAMCAQARIDNRFLCCLTLCFVLSRAASALAFTAFPCAEAIASAFSPRDMPQKQKIQLLLCFIILMCEAGLAIFGGEWALPAAAAVLGLCYYIAVKKLGGITPELADWFLQLCEMAMLFALVISQNR